MEIEYPGRKAVLSNIYRSPSPSPISLNSFNSKLESLLSNLNSLNHQALIFSDTNINLLNLTTNNHIASYMDTVTNNGFLQLVLKATRIQNNSSTLIDHILANNLTGPITSGVILSDISDHFITFVQSPILSKSKPHKTIESRTFSQNAIVNFRNSLRALSWNSTISCNSVNTSFDNFMEDFLPLFNLHFPITKKKFNKNFHKINDFMTGGLLVSRNTKNKLHKKSIAEPSEINVRNYKTYRNLFNKVLRKSKTIYFEHNLKENEKNPKKTWDILKEITGKKSKQQKITEIKINGLPTNDPSEIANEFNSFFSTIGTKISDGIENIDKDPLSYIRDNPDTPQFEMGGTGEVEVRNFLNSIDKKNSPDLDGISLSLLKCVSNEISGPLGHIFNLSLLEGVFPEKLKASRIVPIFKAGDKTMCDNYRPISLVSSISKILEKIVANKLIEHLTSNNLIFEHQYGFLKGKSTEHNLIHLINSIGKAINENKFCIGVFLDLKKAFDVVPHNILLKKLKKLGINGVPLQWFKSYLSNRTQKVDINGNLSSSKNIPISVMQGTILGPILFLVFINDIPSATVMLTRLFADDTACTLSHSDLPTLINLVNIEIQKLANWFKANKMAVNISKTKYIIFHGKGKRVNMNGLEVVFNDNEIGKPQNPEKIFPLERVHDSHQDKNSRFYKLLGVLFDETLSFKPHIDYTCNKINKSLFCINRSKNFLTSKALKSLYYALIHPHLLYCINVYSATSPSNLKRLTLLQKKAIRTIHKVKSNAHTAPLFISSSILPLDKLILQAKLMFMHSIEYGYGLPTFINTWEKNHVRNPDVNLRNADHFAIPHPRVDSFKLIPLYSFPFEWNRLQDELKYQYNRTTFKIALKNALFESLTPD